MATIVISVDGACSGRRCACAAIAMQDGRLVAEGSRNLPEAGGYVLAAEIAGVSLAARLLPPSDDAATVIVETDNPDVPRVIARGYRPRQASRLPAKVLDEAIAFTQQRRVVFKLLPRNSTPACGRPIASQAANYGRGEGGLSRVDAIYQRQQSAPGSVATGSSAAYRRRHSAFTVSIASALSAVLSERCFKGLRWWVHEDSNLGPAD